MDEFQIFLKSRQGTSLNGSPASVEFDFTNNPKIIDNSDIFTVCVKQAAIKVSWYNINSYNNLLVINNTGYSIPIGNYNVYTLVTVLDTLLTSLSITVTYDDDNGNYTFTKSSGSFQIYSTSTCDELLGLDFTNSDILSSVSSVYVATLVADLSYASTIYVTSPELLNISKDSYSSSAISDTLASINVSVNSLGIVNYEGFTYTTLYRKIIDKFTIVLKDDNNNILQMNGGWWNITLNFKIVPDHRIKAAVANVEFF
jgi:hypothetical protein